MAARPTDDIGRRAAGVFEWARLVGDGVAESELDRDDD